MSRSPESSNNTPELNQGGAFRELDKKKLEAEVVLKLKKLGANLTNKELWELMAAVTTTKNLESLREKLGTKTNEKTNDVLLQEILSLVESIRTGAAEWIKELKIDIRQVLKNEPVLLKKGVFFSEKIPGITRFEKSELWENLILDIGGFAVGALDTLMVCLTTILNLLRDIFLLPRDLLAAKKSSPQKSKD